ncbi:MAG: hypothetical protein KA314_23140 [Chloroflexi bacterium]|nr:hypothetical protein [Chloroflexota bacterium]MBP8058740.1 hypothetical protein [Chloroflexota bacterium]
MANQNQGNKRVELSEQEVRQVAEKVYGLFLAELRSDRERMGAGWQKRHLRKRP